MKIVMHTTYYAPHVSGLTIYFQRLAESYARLGHEVAMLTSRHDKILAKNEECNGVRVIRSSVWLRVNKGLLMPFQLFDAWKYLRACDVVHFNLPAFEAFPLALLARLLGKKVVSTYVCDITLPQFWGSRLLNKLADLANWLTFKLSHEVVSYTLDFAQESRLLKNFANVHEIYPQVSLPVATTPSQSLSLLSRQNGPIIAMATRLAADKGVEYLLDALPAILQTYPGAKVAFAGNVSPVGEERYVSKMRDMFKEYANQIVILGELPQNQMQNFYNAIDLLVVASVNSTEAFGIVQIEAMLTGCPVVATDLPGVRVPVKLTGMGAIARVADSPDLAEKILRVLATKYDSHKVKQQLQEIFADDKIVNSYIELYG